MMNTPILVVGATGNVGSALVPLLAERGQSVRAATRNPEAYTAATPQVAAVRFDYDDPTTFGPALANVQRLFLLAMPADPRTTERLIPFLDAAQAAGVTQIVLMTAMGVDQAEGAPLRLVEQHLEQLAVEHTILRPNWFMQNFYPGWLYATIQSQRTFYLPAEEARVSFISARDIAAVATTVLTEPGHANTAYTLTGGEALSHTEVAAMLSEVGGREIRYIAVAEEALRTALRDTGWGAAESAYMAALFVPLRAGYAAPVSPDVERILGRKPITFGEFAQEHAAAWR